MMERKNIESVESTDQSRNTMKPLESTPTVTVYRIQSKNEQLESAGIEHSPETHKIVKNHESNRLFTESLPHSEQKMFFEQSEDGIRTLYTSAKTESNTDIPNSVFVKIAPFSSEFQQNNSSKTLHTPCKMENNTDMASSSFVNSVPVCSEFRQNNPPAISYHISKLHVRPELRAIALLRDTMKLNVGGTLYTTTERALAREGSIKLSKQSLTRLVDRKGRCFIDRDGQLFALILQYLETGQIILENNGEGLREIEGLKNEARYYKLPVLLSRLEKYNIVEDAKTIRGEYVTLTIHATYNLRFRKDIHVGFKRISSITVAGHVRTCQKIFDGHLSMDRDTNDTNDRYSCRMVLTCLQETFIFSLLEKHNYELVASAQCDAATKSKQEKYDGEQDQRWMHVTNHSFRKIY